MVSPRSSLLGSYAEAGEELAIRSFRTGGGDICKVSVKIKDLEREKLVQQVQYDQLLSRQRRSGAETEGLLEAASEPGITESEKDLDLHGFLGMDENVRSGYKNIRTT